ncbi:hypothetical protein E2C01_084113 [Portunus trituberculatus]|uniref:Uncharacterized protein n=1 Tax=Portunus trituberculatus TaxID=210409 RepID=A0A5B7J8C1_PORTR|nr:hypothetical protein [Portunus trituberculatus]
MTLPTATFVLQDKPKISKHESGPGLVQKVIQPPKVPPKYLRCPAAGVTTSAKQRCPVIAPPGETLHLLQQQFSAVRMILPAKKDKESKDILQGTAEESCRTHQFRRSRNNVTVPVPPHRTRHAIGRGDDKHCDYCEITANIREAQGITLRAPRNVAAVQESITFGKWRRGGRRNGRRVKLGRRNECE